MTGLDYEVWDDPNLRPLEALLKLARFLAAPHLQVQGKKAFTFSVESSAVVSAVACDSAG
jgi:hypothetical protein